MLGTYGSAVAICAVALALGRGAVILCGVRGGSWLSPSVGLALVLALSTIFVHLPGHGYTAGAILLALSVAAVTFAARRGEPWPPLAEGLPVAIVVFGITTIPFLANDRVGVPGISVLNDTHWHLFLAQGLLQPSIRHLDDYGFGYPIGPHAIAAVFGQSVGSSVDRSLTGLLIATPVLTGLTALGVLGQMRPWQRIVPAILAAIPYMAGAWYVQSAFKEPLMSVLLLGIVVALREGREERWAHAARVLVPIALLLVGVIYEYSYPGLLWPIAVLVCWALLELTVGGAWRHLPGVWRWVRAGAWPLAIAVVVFGVLIAQQLPRIVDFWNANGGSSVGTTGGVTTSALANLAGPLPSSEGLNMWTWGDFRFIGPHVTLTHVLAVFALLVLLAAVAWALRARDLPWLGAAVGVALVYLYTKHSQSAYVAAKALMVPAPLLVLGSGAVLVRGVGAAPWRTARELRTAPARVLGNASCAVLAVAFFVISFGSVYLVLVDSQVGPSAHTRELRSLRPLLRGRPTLAMFNDDYFKWELLGVPVSEPGYSSPIPVAVSPSKPWAYGQPLDFDSFSPAQLDAFDYVVSVRSAALSQPPPNFRRVGGSRSYVVYRRTGPTPDFRVLPESGASGAVLDCARPADRRISRRRGTAQVRPRPIAVAVGPLTPGHTESLALRLPAGDWDLSLPFTSSQSVRVLAPGIDVTLAPNLDRPGNPWALGRVHSDGGPLELTIHMDDGPLLGSTSPVSQYFTPQPLIADRAVADRSIPLRRACGRYVDSYRLN